MVCETEQDTFFVHIRKKKIKIRHFAKCVLVRDPVLSPLIDSTKTTPDLSFNMGIRNILLLFL